MKPGMENNDEMVCNPNCVEMQSEDEVNCTLYLGITMLGLQVALLIQVR